MARYTYTDLLLDVPDDWQDRSIIAFAGSPAPGQTFAPNIVVTHDRLEKRETINAYADRQLVQLAQRLPGFKLVSRGEVTVGGLPALELRFNWRGENGDLDQHQVFVSPRKRSVLSFVATALKEDFPRVQGAFGAIYASVRFPGAPGAPKA